MHFVQSKEMESTKTLATFLSLSSILVLLFSIHLAGCNGARILIQEPANTEFVRTSCSKTGYPDLCFNSLSSYASTIQTSPMQLAHTALSITFDDARSTSAAMKTLSKGAGMSHRMAEAMHDCMQTIGDSIDELKQSMELMGHLGGKDLGFQINSIQTWVSAALTDDTTCMDGFSGSTMSTDVKTEVRSHVMNVAHLTSNALAFINSLVTTHSSP